jgi:DNA-binding response OmpR family regulator
LGVRRNASAASPIRLAIVDNDHSQMNLLRQRLQAMAWPHRMLGSPVSPDTLAAMRLDAVVLDLAALGPQGWRYLEQVYDRLPQLGVLVHTERASVAQRVRALRLGADDWVSKPCHAEELIARIEALVRRRRRSNEIASEPVMIGELALVPGEYQATVGDTALELTRREFELLELLADGRARYTRVRRSTSGCGATRWCVAIDRSTSTCASYDRSSKAHRPAGATCTRTSVSGTASQPNWSSPIHRQP